VFKFLRHLADSGLERSSSSALDLPCDGAAEEPIAATLRKVVRPKRKRA
jgi:hypothetical protein